MSRQKEDTDGDLDARVRAASAMPTDESATFYKVLSRLDAAPQRSPIQLPSLAPSMALASFAALMLAAGTAGYALPDLAAIDPDDQILALAFGGSDAVRDPFELTVPGSAK
ncbi:MAG: hypothetical protein AAFP68_03870 [Pseudomonadota bacterium]